MMETVEFVFKEADHTLVRRNITEESMRMPDGALERLSAQAPRTVPAVFTIGGQLVHLKLVPNGFSYLTLPLPVLELRCRYAVVAETVVLSMTGGMEPVTFRWTPPDTMGLRLLFQVRPIDTGVYRLDKMWVFAVDRAGATYRLPLGNLYDDCGLCAGRDVFRGQSLQRVVELGLQQVEKSDWNADLWRDAECTQKLFRFTPVKDGFETLPPAETWTLLCRKVATGAGSHLVLL